MLHFLFFIIVGGLAGWVATRAMKLETSMPVTVVIGVGGAFVGWLVLTVLFGIIQWVVSFIGAVLFAVLLIWLWQRYVS